jgi:spore coat polysaccharide biosynthesis protein SpsF
MLQHVVERCQRAHTVQEVVVATTSNYANHKQGSVNRPIHSLCDALRVECYGVGASVCSEDDVLGRYYKVARAISADVIVRVTGDCPLVDPTIIDGCVRRHLETEEYERTPDGNPKGADVEVFSIEALHMEQKYIAKSSPDREHVTSSMYETTPDYDPTHRLCVDYIEDLVLMREVFGALGPGNNFSIGDVVKWLNLNPLVAAINKDIAHDMEG